MFNNQLVDHSLLHSDSIDVSREIASFVKGHIEGRAGGTTFKVESEAIRRSPVPAAIIHVAEMLFIFSDSC